MLVGGSRVGWYSVHDEGCDEDDRDVTFWGSWCWTWEDEADAALSETNTRRDDEDAESDTTTRRSNSGLPPRAFGIPFRPRTQPNRLNGLNQGNRFHFRRLFLRWCYLNSDLPLANDVYCSVFFRAWSCRLPRGIQRRCCPPEWATGMSSHCRPWFKLYWAHASLFLLAEPPPRTHDECRLGLQNESDHHERGVLQGPQTLMKRFPQNVNNQSKTDTADNHLNRPKSTIIKVGLPKQQDATTRGNSCGLFPSWAKSNQTTPWGDVFTMNYIYIYMYI